MSTRFRAYAAMMTEMAPHLEEIEAAIASHLKTKSTLVETISHHVIDSGGKRLRPLLMIICARMCGYAGKDFAHLATVIEYLHSATLLHDDVLDEAHLRRGNPSANSRWGNAAAVLSGDYLFSQAFTLLVKHYPVDITLTMLGAAVSMIDGEVIELSKRRQAALSRDEYREIIDLKTASLLAASCRSGALLAGAGPDRCDALAGYGRSLGMAFQIIDDVLDFTGDPARFGKTPGGDLREGTVTLPVIILLEKLSGGERRWLEKLVTEGASDPEVARVTSLIRETGADADACGLAEEHVREARAALESFEANRYRAMLEVAADYALSRRV